MRGFLIGNGFDLAHGMKSKFSDFYRYEVINNPTNISCFDGFYDMIAEEIWGNFEDNIGRIDYELFMEHMGSIYDEKDEYGLTECAEDVDFEHLLCDYNEMAKDLKLWTNKLSMPNRKYSLSSDDLYLSFNYTYVLEKVYKIKKSNILHIHGESNRDNIILGYDNIDIEKVLSGADRGIYTRDFPYEYEGFCILREFLCRFHKNTNDIILRNKTFIDRFADCEEVYIVGLSFSKTDINYLNYIINVLKKPIKIYLSYYSKSDRARISWFIRKNKLSNVTVKKIDDLLLPRIN